MPLSEAVAKTDGPYQLHGLERAVSVLEALSESDTPLSLAEICQRMGLHKSTAHRSLMVRCWPAHLLPGDNPRERQRWLSSQLPSSAGNARAVRLFGTQLLTIRIDLDD